MQFVLALVFFMAGSGVGFAALKVWDNSRINGVKNQIEKMLEDAENKSEQIKQTKISETREEVNRLRQEAQKDIKDRRTEIQRTERKLEQKEENLDKKLDKVSRKEDELKNKHEEIEKRRLALEEKIQKQDQKLQEIADMSKEQAQEVLLQKVEADAKHMLGLKLKDLEENYGREAEKKARDLIVGAMQRCVVESAGESSISVVPLPSEEMKGRIIGREGRNIRTFESLTGVDLIIDDTPEAVTLSCFDPIRREIARRAMEKLVVDGRIHPARIEDLIERAARDIDNEMISEGENAVLEMGIKNMNNELMRTLGQLKFRFSYGQNVLAHSIEVAQIAGILAAELGLDEETARRGGLLHDIGKAIDRQIEGPHAEIGAELAKRLGERPEIVSCIASHHNSLEVTSVYEVIVEIADAISASRPGARRESLDAYIKRLDKLEEIAQSFEGVTRAYAIQAGREVRVILNAAKTDEGTAHKIAFDIAKRVETELKYPGQIKINVSRETRATEYAK
ncbi:MAG: ribonuclease Y [Synergistaceae bacterium]|nr:ribonuclease Y [Synergistaceae bacterium]MBQ6737042.1 ribonuclease Y [Synergistaceae bacterium]MBQ7068101.1 ribonuclease Y [Synergistaceae bacterium]MBR0074371.1 ribonuclease Y [Synergistaceae bacterium]MBR0232628.1 ribonuclease Y [Synergistaceae bacterium]